MTSTTVSGSDGLVPSSRHILRRPQPMDSVMTKFSERQAIRVVPNTFIQSAINMEYRGGYSRKGSCRAAEYHAKVVHPIPFT